MSVRVRPDAGTSDAKADGEWMVDGRRSLVSYRGREGGDYYYGNLYFLGKGVDFPLTDFLQIMFSLHMIRMLKFTMLLQSDWSDVSWKDTMEQFLHMV